VTAPVSGPGGTGPIDCPNCGAPSWVAAKTGAACAPCMNRARDRAIRLLHENLRCGLLMGAGMRHDDDDQGIPITEASPDEVVAWAVNALRSQLLPLAPFDVCVHCGVIECVREDHARGKSRQVRYPNGEWSREYVIDGHQDVAPVLSNDQREDLADALFEALFGVFDRDEEEAAREAVELRDAAVAWLAREGIVHRPPVDPDGAA
jgi:hypothetical protein